MPDTELCAEQKYARPDLCICFVSFILMLLASCVCSYVRPSLKCLASISYTHMAYYAVSVTPAHAFFRYSVMDDIETAVRMAKNICISAYF
jgi:hypothetical protein